MKYVDEFRDRRAAEAIARKIRETVTRPWTVMEVCGGQTHAIVRFGLDALLPDGLELVHGPGCPVCVTPIEKIDQAIQLASCPKVIFCSFGDMLRVPGSQSDLLTVKANGGDVRVIYSPLDALAVAQAHPDREIVCFAVGFETTAPTYALAVRQARELGLPNFSLLVAHVLVPPAMEAIVRDPENRIDGFLAAGHVCTVMGYEDYHVLADRYRTPIVVTGFEPLDILEGLALLVTQLEEGRAEVENQYTRSVRRAGNPQARSLVHEIFEPVPQTWRGMGELPKSGLALRSEYAAFDALDRFKAVLTRNEPSVRDATECQSGLVLQGRLKPTACAAFGTRCTPETPLGAPMVSSEGACAAYYRYRGKAGGGRQSAVGQ